MVTSYIATCPASAARCKTPVKLSIRFELRQIPGIKPASGRPIKTITRTIPIATTSSQFAALEAATGNPNTPSSSGGSGGSSFGPAALLMFTSTKVPGSASVADRTALCESEAGTDYRAARALEIAAHWKGGVNNNDAGRFFRADSDVLTDVFEIEQTGGYLRLVNHTNVLDYRVACIHKGAPLLFTSTATKMTPSSTLDQRRALCVNELGASYRPARTHEIAAIWSYVPSYESGYFGYLKMFLLDSEIIASSIWVARETNILPLELMFYPSPGMFLRVACIRN